jgi:hypothetical protein
MNGNAFVKHGFNGSVSCSVGTRTLVHNTPCLHDHHIVCMQGHAYFVQHTDDGGVLGREATHLL